MKLTILIISMCIAGAFCDYLECYIREAERCDMRPLPEKFPATIDELKRDCMNFLDYKNCWRYVDEVCEQDINVVLRKRDVVRFLNATCQEDSPIFKVVASHFDCLSSAFKSTVEFCNETRMKAHYAARAKYGEQLLESENRDLRHCRKRPFPTQCLPIILGEKCGDEFGNAILEFMTNVYYRTCVGEIPEKWGVLYELYETVIREEYARVKVFEERRR